jgi:hypothetical protein
LHSINKEEKIDVINFSSKNSFNVLQSLSFSNNFRDIELLAKKKKKNKFLYIKKKKQKFM